MFEPVPMTHLRLVILERDERAVLRHLGSAGVVQLTRSLAGPDTAPLPPRNRGGEMARLEHISARLDNLRRSLELSSNKKPLKPVEISLEQAEKDLHLLEERSAGLLKERQQLQQRLTELAAVSEQIADYREMELPLDERNEASFLHFVTGSLPAKNFEELETGGNIALLPLAKRNGRQLLIAMTTRQGRPGLDHILQEAGFQPERLPMVAGATSAALSEQNRQEEEAVVHKLEQINAQLKSLAEEFEPARAQIENLMAVERRMLEAEQHFSRTESSVLISGWVPGSDVAALVQHIQEITRGRCVIEAMAAEKVAGAEVPVLLRHPRLFRPFAMLVTAYGLPKYHELEPTLFVAISYLVMFGMMFGDAGQGLVLALAGVSLLFVSQRAALRQAGVLLSFAGASSIISGVIYGSYFGLGQFKQYAIWHDPLAGNPARLLAVAIGIGVVMISLGLVLNILNQLRHGRFLAAFFDKFGVAGAVFYWGALALATKSAAIRAHGVWTPSIALFLVVPVICWILKEPFEAWQNRGGEHGARGSFFGVAMESFVNAFEALLSYFANTVSFVRLAAYAMSHAALLMATFMIAENLKLLPFGGNLLSAAAIILGNVVTIVLEGVVASVQALRLEYYEFFGKFFSGGGRPFEPFCLQTTPVAKSPL